MSFTFHNKSDFFQSFVTKTCIGRRYGGVCGEVHRRVGDVRGSARPGGVEVGGGGVGEGGRGRSQLGAKLGEVRVGERLACCDPSLRVKVQHFLRKKE